MLVYPSTLKPECPVIKQATLVFEQSSNLRSAIRQLRIALRACNDCEFQGQCTALIVLNKQIDSAIDALTVEWGLV